MSKELSEAQVEYWLLQNKEAASRIYERNAIMSSDKVRNQNAFYRQFYQMAQKVNSYLDVEKILMYLSKSAVELIQAERCSIFLLDNDTDELTSIVFDIHSKPSTHLNTQIRVKKGHGIVGTVAIAEKCMNIKDAYSEPLFNSTIDRETGFRTESILSMPIFEPTENGKQVVGVANLINKYKLDDKGKKVVTHFSPEDQELFDSVLVLVGIALRNAKLYESTFNLLQENMTLYQISEKESKRANFLLNLAEKISVENNIKDLVSSILLYFYIN